VYSTITSVIGSSIFPHEIEITIVFETKTTKSTAPAATGKVASSGQSIFPGAGSWISIAVTVTIGLFLAELV
jgi:hypothetical protein